MKINFQSIILIFSLTIFFFSCKNTREKNEISDPKTTEIISPPPVLFFSIPKDSFNISHHRIRRNETLADILLRFDIPYIKIDSIDKYYKNVFDLRKIRRGNKYFTFTEKDSISSLKYFVYQIDPIEYLKISFQDSLNLERKKKEIHSIRKESTGIIETSLWNTIKDNDLNMNLALELSEIYAWSIDFFGIQKGDKFSVVYDEEYVDSISIGIGNIYSACFHHNNHPYYAFQFEQDSALSYFDEKGNSLRKAFLKAPLRFNRISSKFSHSRYHPVLKIRRPHHGIDYAAPSGTPVYAIGDGTIIKKGYQKNGGGRYLKIKHNSVYTSVYMHFSGYAKNISEGKFVSQGDLIGYVGQSGLATGPHLDFRMYKNGTAIDPLKIEAPPVEPVAKDNIQNFNIEIEKWKPLLDSLSIQI